MKADQFMQDRICRLEDVIIVRRSLALLCITLVVSVTFSLRADTDENSLDELNDFLPSHEPSFAIDFGWLVGDYEFDWIGDIDEYYGTYFRHWESYLTNKQKEFAGKFGLSNIFFKFDLEDYKNTKVVFSKSISNDRLLLRYLAPVDNMGDFDLSIAIKPHRRVTLIARGHMNGERSIAIVIKKSFGSEDTYTDQRARRFLRRAKRLLGY